MKKEYEELQKKYNLPSLKEMDSDFQISTIEKKIFLTREIVKKISEKMEKFTHLMEEILSPESGLSSLNESSMFDTEEKKEILKIYRKLMYNHRTNTLLSINYDEKEYAKQINILFDEWQIMKPSLEKIVKKMQNSWNKDKKTKLELSYFG